MSVIETLVQRGPGNFPSKPNHPSSLTHIPLTINPYNLVHPNEPPISDKLYAGFIEHLGRCIYGGIVDDPKHPSPPELLVKQDKGTPETKGRAAWRKDVMQLLGKEGDLQVPMLRWPGGKLNALSWTDMGNFVSNYHWQDGIGPIEKRPKRIELAWLSHETNQWVTEQRRLEAADDRFGTNEFIDYCRASGCEPYICLNSESGRVGIADD